jgi:hypothetical protein
MFILDINGVLDVKKIKVNSFAFALYFRLGFYNFVLVKGCYPHCRLSSLPIQFN